MRDHAQAAEHAVPADRCAHEIVGFLTRVGGALAAAERQLVGRLGQRGRQPVFDFDESGAIPERSSCRLRRAGARCAGVVRRPVVRIARRAKRAYVLGVVPIMARCAGVIACWRGTFMRAASQRHSPARPTRPCSRPLRAIAGILAVVVVRSRRLMGNPLDARLSTPYLWEQLYQYDRTFSRYIHEPSRIAR